MIFEDENYCKEFVGLMDGYMPCWQEIRKRLNKQILDWFNTK